VSRNCLVSRTVDLPRRLSLIIERLDFCRLNTFTSNCRIGTTFTIVMDTDSEMAVIISFISNRERSCMRHGPETFVELHIKAWSITDGKFKLAIEEEELIYISLGRMVIGYSAIAMDKALKKPFTAVNIYIVLIKLSCCSLPEHPIEHDKGF